MPKLDDLLSDLANFDAQHDLQGLRKTRETIVSEHPDSEAAVEAMYKIGLDHLFRERDLVAAVARFEEASKRKHPFWSAAARTSLGLCYYHQGRGQKALLELRGCLTRGSTLTLRPRATGFAPPIRSSSPAAACP